MSDARFARAEELFWGARALAPAARRAWLEESCGHDRLLLADVEALLAAAEATGPLGTPSAAEIAAWMRPAEAADLTGRVVGGCRLERLLGQGGMGRVYAALQEPPGRRVAVKLLREAFPDEGSRARFEHEARLLAAVEHPGVARLLAAGSWASPSGEALPYTVLELVEDPLPITQAAQARGLDRRARLSWMVEVCAAVQACHGRGVLHRDLKPANIVVGRDGRPRVIDFGIARALGEAPGVARRTASGALLGTPTHMSPEQLLGREAEVDARSDVHALGVVLYELLTGRLPRDFGAGSLVEVLRALRERLPTPPEVHEPRLAGDVSAVTLKALDPDPARRYQTAAELGADLVRLLEHRPVLARPAGAWRVLGLWVRRHRALAAVGAALCASVLAGTAVAWWTAGAERRAREAADLQRARAEGFLRRSKDFVPWLLFDLQRQVAGLPGGAAAAARLAQGVREHLQALAFDQVDDVELLLTAAYAYHLLAEVGGGLGPDLLRLPEQARRDLESARALSERADGLAPSPVAKDLLARAHLGLARLALSAGRGATGAAHLEEAREVLALQPAGRVVTPFALAVEPRLALGLLEANTLDVAQRPAEALERLRTAWQAHLALHPDGDVPAAEVLSAALAMARYALRAGDMPRAEAARGMLEAALAALERDDSVQGALAALRHHSLLADAAMAAGQDGLPELARAREAAGRWGRAAPGDRRPRREEAALLRRIGTTHVNAGRPEQGRPALEAGVRLCRALLAEDAEDAETTFSLLQCELALAEAACQSGDDVAADTGLAQGRTTQALLEQRFQGSVAALEGRARVPLTQSAVDALRAARADKPADAARLLAQAADGARAGEAAYAAAFAAYPGITYFHDTAALCRAEVERLDRLRAEAASAARTPR